MGKAEGVANTVLFLASDESSCATGAEFMVDGGLTAQLPICRREPARQPRHNVVT